LAGKAITGWFWKLALPDWQGQNAVQWVVAAILRIAEAADTDLDRRRVLLAFDVADRLFLDKIIAQFAGTKTLQDIAPPQSFSNSHQSGGTGSGEEQPLRERGKRVFSSEDTALESLVRVMLHAMPPKLHRTLLRLAVHLPEAPLRALLTAYAARHFPMLYLLPGRADALISALVLRLVHPAPDASPSQRQQTETPPAPVQTKLPVNRDVQAVPARYGSAHLAATAAEALAAPLSRSQPLDVQDRRPQLSPSAERADTAFDVLEAKTAAAGLFLLIRPLLHLGWREWLVTRQANDPALLLANPAAQLMAHLAQHYRIPDEDPAAKFWAAHMAADVPALTLDQLQCWRVGLDRWLRRRAGLSLARIICRAGWLMPYNGGIIIRYPLACAEVGLRRHALDCDPGWVDWLGFSVRYVYDDRPSWPDGHG
jgi:hypothetical protein